VLTSSVGTVLFYCMALPGTGKVSLCKALAQKLAIHLNHRYTQEELIEINSYSLFLKWFSEICIVQCWLNAHATL
jgi:hypothetical protein